MRDYYISWDQVRTFDNYLLGISYYSYLSFLFGHIFDLFKTDVAQVIVDGSCDDRKDQLDDSKLH